MRYSTADAELPDHADYEEEEEEEEATHWTMRSGRIPSHTGNYYFTFNETDFDHGPTFAALFGKMFNAETDEVVGVLKADLVTRTKYGVYTVCDDESHELITLARTFINNDGSLRSGISDQIDDSNRCAAAGKGGFLHIYEVHIRRSCRGNDLALQFVFALMH